MSDELDLSETTCERYWILASAPVVLQKLETIVGKDFCENHEAAAEELFLLDCSDLFESICLLFRARYDNTLLSSQRLGIVEMTNRLLRENLLLNLLSIVNHFVDVLAKEFQTTCGDDKELAIYSKRAFLADKYIVEVAKCVYFVVVEVQVVEEEAWLLLDVLKVLSELTASIASGSVGRGQLYGDIERSLFSSLVLLQLAQVRALTQQRALLSRFDDGGDFGDRAVGNSLPQHNSKEDLDQPWTCSVAKGFSCLVYAVFRQPVVEENDRVPFTNLSWFLHEAASMRAFLYVRSCVVPLLQSSCFDCLLRVELMQTLLTDLLLPFAQLYATDDFLRSRSDRDASASMDGDCLEDLLGMFADAATVCPEFALDLLGRDFIRVEGASGRYFDSRFIQRAVEGNIKRDWMWPFLSRLLCGLTGGGKNRDAARYVFEYVDRSVLSWDAIFKADHLMSFLHLISCAVKDEDTAKSLRHLNPIETLFDLLRKAESSDDKGALLISLSSYCVFTSTIYRVHFLFPGGPRRAKSGVRTDCLGQTRQHGLFVVHE